MSQIILPFKSLAFFVNYRVMAIIISGKWFIYSCYVLSAN